MLILSGASTHPVDADNRFRIPDKFRYNLGQEFVMTRGLGCVCVMPQDEFERIAKRVYEMGDPFMSHIDPNLAKIQRYLFSGAVTASTDKQNRVTLNPELRKHAGIDKEVVITGRGKVIEVWDPTRWDEYCKTELTTEQVYDSGKAIAPTEAKDGQGLPQAGPAEGDD